MGVLKDMGEKFAQNGWDDVPTLKLIGGQDMDALGLTDAQRNALELRIYLHNRSLMKYADKMEASKIGLVDLMSMKPSKLASKFKMGKNHVATFVNTSMPYGIQMPPIFLNRRRLDAAPTLMQRIRPPRKSNAGRLGFLENSCARNSPPRKPSAGDLRFNGNPLATNSPPRKSNAEDLGFNGNPFARNSPPRKSNAGELGFRSSYAKNSPPRKSNAGGLGFSGNPCMVKAPSSDKVAKISVLEKVSLRQLAPEHSYGVDSRTLKGSRELPPFQAANLWSRRATLFFCIRRPGCVMCRAEAHQLFAHKPMFDALGIQLVAVLLENIDEEVWAFWPRYWAGMVVLDEKRDLFRALGGGKLMKDNLLTGFFLNPIARLNLKRAMKTGIRYNTRGEGTIKGGMFIVRRGNGGVAYQFAEKNFGDWAPLDEVLQVCHVIREGGDCDNGH